MTSLEDKRNFASIVRGKEIIPFKKKDIQAVYGMIAKQSEDSKITLPSEILNRQENRLLFIKHLICKTNVLNSLRGE